MKNNPIIDHLFRHQYGRMVSILTRIFGLNNLTIVEDAVQDTFISAMLKWRNKTPENPEGWLMRAAKNRAIDIIRKDKAEIKRFDKISSGQAIIAIDKLFLEEEIVDSQLRMIFTACHPKLHPKDQIAFSLKTIAGFSTNEIANALLLKKETVKKRLTRARKAIHENNISFKLPSKSQLLNRLNRVHEVLYLIFNEGFHAIHKEMDLRKELCGEAIRLIQIILTNLHMRNGASYALFALMCFHASRLESKSSETVESVSLKDQDRSQWYQPLINVGYNALAQAMTYDDHSVYHLEASIAMEHINSKTFAATNWEKILSLYTALYDFQPNSMTALNIAMVHILLNQNEKAIQILEQIKPKNLEQKSYLYYGVMAEYYQNLAMPEKANDCLNEALERVNNDTEKAFLEKKKNKLNL